MEIGGILTPSYPYKSQKQPRYNLETHFCPEKPVLFTGRSGGGRSRTHFVSQSVSKCQMSRLMASNAKSAQSKDV